MTEAHTIHGGQYLVVEDKLITTWTKDGKQFQYVALIVRDKPKVEP